MKDYGRIYGVFWTSGDIKPLGDQPKLLAAYLLTCTHSTIAGTFYLPEAYVAEDLSWGSETVSQAFAELDDIGFATLCPETKWVWVRKFLEWNAPENPNQWKAVRKMVEKVPSRCLWIGEFERSLNPSETLSEPVGHPVEPFQQPVGTVSKSVSVSVTGTVLESAPAALPPTDATEVKSKRRGKAQCQLVQLPSDFALTDRMREQAVKKHFDCDVESWFESFCAYHRANGNAMKDWHAAWVTWIGNGSRFGYPKKSNGRADGWR